MGRSLRVLRLVVLAASAALALTIAGPGVSPVHAVFDDRDRDGVIDLAEETAGSDPDDPSSTPEATGVTGYYNGCDDGIDNDRDGLIDAADSGCTNSDGDFVSDDAEAIYGSDPHNRASSPEDSRFDAILNYYGLAFFFCADSIDNDGDGLTDRDDPGCPTISNDGDRFDDYTEKRFGSDPGDPNSVPEHDIPHPGSCRDRIDNDRDGLTDAADPGCGSPSNDDRAGALAISSLPFTDGPRPVKNATVERTEPQPSCNYGSISGTVWYRYTAAADGVLIADTTGSNFSTTIAVWRQNAVGLQEVACYNTYTYLPSARAVFRATAGETYLFQIDGFAYETGLPEIAFDLRTGTPPSNDNFQSAVPIASLPFTHTADTSAAMPQQGEPGPFCGFGKTSSVWYSYTPAADTLLVADSRGSGYDTVIAAWRQDPFGLFKIECNNDAGLSIQSRIAFIAHAGDTYYFQVARGPGGDPSNFDLVFHVELGIPPANDDFAHAAPIASLPLHVVVDTSTATSEAGEPLPSCAYFGTVIDSSVWYSYTAPADMLVMADTQGTENPFASAIAVYRPASPSGVTQVACSLGGYPHTRVAFQAEAGETYFFQLGTVLYRGGKFLAVPAGDAAGYEEAGPISFNVTQLPLPSCPALEFTVADPFGDTFLPPLGDPGIAVHDITRVGGAADRQNFCFTIEFAEAIDPPGSGGDREALVSLDIDVDNNPSTGYQSSIDYSCFPSIAALGVDTQLYMDTGGGILVPIYQNTYAPPPLPDGSLPEQPYALALSGERSITLVVPLRAMGRDDIFDFAVLVRGGQYQTTDCAPNGGHIRSPNPARPGDVNCDGRTNSVDAMLIMRSFARLPVTVPCAYAGDVNGNGGLGPLDAILILQYEAGLVDSLPPVPHSALEAAIRETGRLLNVLRGLLTIVDKEAEQWPDSCLGLPEEGEACLQVVTSGYRIRVQTTSGMVNVLTWRTNDDGSSVRLEKWVLE